MFTDGHDLTEQHQENSPFENIGYQNFHQFEGVIPRKHNGNFPNNVTITPNDILLNEMAVLIVFKVNYRHNLHFFQPLLRKKT